MEFKKIITLTVIGIGLVFGVIVFGMYVSYNNRAVSLNKKADAQRNNVEVVYDQMWKIINQNAQVSNEYKEAFKEIYPELIEGRYSQGDGTLMKFIKESNPDFDVSLYKGLMVSIETERNNFTTQQKTLLDIIREHSTLCNTIPGKWFITEINSIEIEYTSISSTITKEVIKTGVDDNIDLFK